jgi:RimJ/RimL family protein N-acetyltransferase
MDLPLDDGLRLRSLTGADTGTLVETVSAHRPAFDPWLRWSGTIIDRDTALVFIGAAEERERSGRGFHLGLWRGDALLGGVVCWSLDPVHRVAELGYWLVPGERGTGLAARATRAVMRHLFTNGGVNRIEFQCLVENGPSRRLAERVGGQLEGIRRQSHLVAGEFRDHAVYAVLAEDSRPE